MPRPSDPAHTLVNCSDSGTLILVSLNIALSADNVPTGLGIDGYHASWHQKCPLHLTTARTAPEASEVVIRRGEAHPSDRLWWSAPQGHSKSWLKTNPYICLGPHSDHQLCFRIYSYPQHWNLPRFVLLLSHHLFSSLRLHKGIHCSLQQVLTKSLMNLCYGIRYRERKRTNPTHFSYLQQQSPPDTDNKI